MSKEFTTYDKIATVLFKGHEEAANLLLTENLYKKTDGCYVYRSYWKIR